MKRRVCQSVLILALIGVVVGGVTVLSLPRSEPIGRCQPEGSEAQLFPEMQLKRRTAMGLAVSGGGSRAAYLTAAVLREIHRGKLKVLFPFKETENDQDLLDQVDAVSAVSGGSLAATYFVANAAKLRQSNADSDLWREYLNKMAISYRPREWYRFNPAVWLRFLFRNYNRGLLARDDYDKTLFGGATFADLPDRPIAFINAFDVANRVRFVFSKHQTDTGRYNTSFLSKAQLAATKEPKEIFFDNDLNTARLFPNSVTLADAVYASSAYPLAYPNLAIRNCNPESMFAGNLLFLADGGLGDNSGLITLLTRFHAASDTMKRLFNVLVIYIDASTDQIPSSGSLFQQRGIENKYAWHDTIIGHGRESIEASIDMLQEVNLKYVQSTGTEISQLRSDWDHLSDRTGKCRLTHDASWNSYFETGKIALRPLVIRLGLRDLTDPFSTFEYMNVPKEPLAKLLGQNRLRKGIAAIAEEPFVTQLRSIGTDFALSTNSRDILDLAAFLLVQGKLKSDLAKWDEIAGKNATARDLSAVRCDTSDVIRVNKPRKLGFDPDSVF